MGGDIVPSNPFVHVVAFLDFHSIDSSQGRYCYLSAQTCGGEIERLDESREPQRGTCTNWNMEKK
jgi:hypothetical protein